MGLTIRSASGTGLLASRAQSSAMRFMLVPTLVAVLFGACQAYAQEAASTSQTWYTQEQADLGRRDFNTSCAACHGYSMFTRFLKFRTAERYYNKMSGSMPKWAPATLPEQDYVNILAYLLQETGFPAGEVPLTSERARLRQIVLPSLGP